MEYRREAEPYARTVALMLGMDATLLAAAILAVTAGPPPAPAPAETAAAEAPAAVVPAAPRKPARTLMGAIQVAHRSGAIAWAERVEHERDLVAANRAARRLPAARAAMIRDAVGVARAIAADGRLNGERLEPVMKAVEATTHQARFLPMPAAGQRLRTRGDGIVYEYRPGAGVQPHPLATAGRLNALARDCLHREEPGRCDEAGLRHGADALRRLGVRDRRALRFEYTYGFGTGAPLWTSAMAQATAAQALARAGRVTGRREDARAATAAFRGIGALRMYSFKPGMRVLNGELQALIGIADYARISGSREARRLVRREAPSLVRELGLWDTGAWTLYDAGGREATLHYHRLTATFAGEACRRALARGLCPAARRYTRYTWQPPRLSLRVTRVTRAGRRVAVHAAASKSATATITVTGPPGFALHRHVTLARSSSSVAFRARRPGRYRVAMSAVAVNGKRATASATVKAKPRPRRRAAARRRGADADKRSGRGR